ncbi:polyhydroxyalkanoate depolymerase [Fodinicurvata sp. EGI_FJ10296]|uniref:polyhydroxyalkanoate depolymerase n=1 Tax=Fodinicurvata sp. EGI_FJ10296 TaxID=3231908 RepID=UPI00345647AA
MLYDFHDANHAFFTPVRMMAHATKNVLNNPFVPASYTWPGQAMAAGADVLTHITERREKPVWGIDSVEVRGRKLAVTQDIVRTREFCDLVHFRTDRTDAVPTILVVAPMSGHFATLLRGTVTKLLEDHDVYVTDWKDARDVPLESGRFGLEVYIDYVMDYMRTLGSGTHVLAVCQPAPLVLAATALMAARGESAQPRTMTLMGGPVDPRAAPTGVTDLAQSHTLDWFERAAVYDVPRHYEGRRRRVYPGFLQLSAFISMNASRHVNAHLKMYENLIKGDGDSVEAHRAFYDEYLAVMDIPAEFYLETLSEIFQEYKLPRGTMTWRGEPVVPSVITDTALCTIEGEFDDISAPGQTLAAHDMCSGLSSDQRENILQEGVGHYGIFNGRRWRELIYPRLKDFIYRHSE